jgi:hypothetical protein
LGFGEGRRLPMGFLGEQRLFVTPDDDNRGGDNPKRSDSFD